MLKFMQFYQEYTAIPHGFPWNSWMRSPARQSNCTREMETMYTQTKMHKRSQRHIGSTQMLAQICDYCDQKRIDSEIADEF